MLAYPGILFPTVQPVASGGSSVVFGGGTSFDKLFVFPLFTAGTFSGSDVIAVSLSVNMTRLTADSDPHFLIGDGDNLYGALIADNANGEAWTAYLNDAGTVGDSRDREYLFGNAGFPATGEIVTAAFDFAIRATSTGVTVSLGSKSSGVVVARAFDVDNAISLVLMRDNDWAEQYQINSMTISSPAIPAAVPLPGTLVLLMAGLLGLSASAPRPAIRAKRVKR